MAISCKRSVHASPMTRQLCLGRCWSRSTCATIAISAGYRQCLVGCRASSMSRLTAARASSSRHNAASGYQFRSCWQACWTLHYLKWSSCRRLWRHRWLVRRPWRRTRPRTFFSERSMVSRFQTARMGSFGSQRRLRLECRRRHGRRRLRVRGRLGGQPCAVLPPRPRDVASKATTKVLRTLSRSRT